MIAVSAEEGFGRKKSLRADPFHAQAGRGLKKLKEPISHDAAPARDGEVECFSDDVISRYNHSPSLRQLPHQQGGIAMMSVARVNRRI